MDWWIWATAGLLLFVAEVVTNSGFFLFFFGLGALLVALLTAVGVTHETNLQWLLFSVASVSCLVFLRAKVLHLVTPKDPRQDRDTLEGARGVASDTIAPGREGTLELRGSIWRARNVGSTIIAQGDGCVVKRLVGLVVEVERIV